MKTLKNLNKLCPVCGGSGYLNKPPLWVDEVVRLRRWKNDEMRVVVMYEKTGKNYTKTYRITKK